MARSPITFLVTADTGRMERMLGLYAKSVLPKAAAYEINASLFKARDALRDTARIVLDRPTDFSVKNAFGFTMARLDGAGSVKGRIFIKDRQSAYLGFNVVGGGGIRKPGKVGPGEKWLFMPVARELIDDHGNLRKNTLKALIRRGQGKAGSAKVHRTTKARDAKKRPVWFGTVFGVRGIWERPERTRATAPRQVGVRQVHNLAAPRLLVAAYAQEDYRRPQLDFTAITAKAHADFPDRLRARINTMLQQAIDRDTAKARRAKYPPQVPSYLGALLK